MIIYSIFLRIYAQFKNKDFQVYAVRNGWRLICLSRIKSVIVINMDRLQTHDWRLEIHPNSIQNTAQIIMAKIHDDALGDHTVTYRRWRRSSSILCTLAALHCRYNW